jgi:hypothetical protein
LYRSRAFRDRGLLEEPDHALPDCSPGESDALVLLEALFPKRPSDLPVPEPVFVDLDWTDAAIADPARDLALIYRDLGPEACRLVPAHYEGSFGDADRKRAVFYARCKLIEDLAYGLGTPGARRYAEVGLSHLARTFEPFA